MTPDGGGRSESPGFQRIRLRDFLFFHPDIVEIFQTTLQSALTMEDGLYGLPDPPVVFRETDTDLIVEQDGRSLTISKDSRRVLFRLRRDDDCVMNARQIWGDDRDLEWRTDLLEIAKRQAAREQPRWPMEWDLAFAYQSATQACRRLIVNGEIELWGCEGSELGVERRVPPQTVEEAEIDLGLEIVTLPASGVKLFSLHLRRANDSLAIANWADKTGNEKRNDFSQSQLKLRKKAGRKPRGDKMALIRFAGTTLDERGTFSDDQPGWKTKADLVRLMSEYASKLGSEFSDSTMRGYADEALAAWQVAPRK